MIIFRIQSENVQHLRQIINILKTDINNAIKESDDFRVAMQTKLLALTYSAWSEAQFIQIVYTPNIFTEDEIKSLLKDSGIFNKWKMLIKFSFLYKEKFDLKKKLNIINFLKQSKPEHWKLLIEEENNNYNQNKILSKKRKLEITNYLEKYIDKQSKIRNKIAHGQWINGLMDDDDTFGGKKLDEELTNKIKNLNVVDIMIEFEVHTTLGKIIRDLVQSPHKGFNNNYQKYIDELNDFFNKSSLWTISDKKNRLKLKDKRIFCEKCKTLLTKGKEDNL